MIINFRQISASEAPVEFHQTLDVDHVVQGRKDIMGISPMQADLQAEPAGGGVIHVTGRLSAELDMSCSRCLKPLKHHVDVRFEEAFKQSDEESVELDEAEEELVLVSDERLNLVPYLEEALLLELPFSAVCKETCKGLCPSCGTDLNEQQCGCNTERIDPRLAALGDFFKK
ncbi:YceD family protein [Paenibacillus aceti]|uniref:DUF177 domain-containing protein n=1 Tax=Paenibacillus aceti TaxID=1820010 RepID=A0ABQ1W4J3_9BACL|nr:DUF177 domain-containing protein [Paenibacillus aceti]GGG12205.1 hypothetical protein GCM10010913_37540 [Paenibacillus aceti]